MQYSEVWGGFLIFQNLISNIENITYPPPKGKTNTIQRFFFHIIFIFCQDINKGCLSTPDGNVTCGFHFSIFFKTNPHCPVLVDTLSLSTKSSGVVLRVFICSLYEQQAKSRWLRCDRPELAARIVTTAVVSLAEQSWKKQGKYWFAQNLKKNIFTALLPTAYSRKTTKGVVSPQKLVLHRASVAGLPQNRISIDLTEANKQKHRQRQGDLHGECTK